MDLEKLIAVLESDEQVAYQVLIDQAESHKRPVKEIRGQLAQLVIQVLKRLGEKTNPGPIIAQFVNHYMAKQDQ